MDLQRCTPGQRETVLTLDGPLMVAAGAGSGKTFTLTQRIVHGFSPGSGADGAPFLTSIDQVMAITFTRKAAAELRSRIKGLLVAEGFEEEALAVDDGWITTIHGMASRLLRENALELGIDPAFEVISESLREELHRQATDSILEEAALLQDEELRSFLASAPLFAMGGRGRGIVEEAQAVMARAASMPYGLDGVVVPEPSLRPIVAMEAMIALGEEFLTRAAQWEKPGKGEQVIVEAMTEAVAGAREWVASPESNSLFTDATFAVDGFRDAFYAFPFSGANAPTKKNRTEFFDEHNVRYGELAEEVEAALGARHGRLLLRFARKLDERYDELLGPDRFDQSELLRRCVRALEEHPVLAARYRERFELIMVDEFQDTDSLQVKLIGLLAREGLSNVCVVGDAQQSIYRFRGADVNVFFAYERDLAALNDRARFPKLTDNFRSHGDVLGFVDAIFSQPASFGARFLQLAAKGRVNEERDPLFENGELSRVTLDVVGYDPRVRNETKVSSAGAVGAVAARVADHFARLKAAGAETQDMALLLGSMSSAAVFADALRQRGIDSVITGGSVFTSTRPARLVAALLRYAVNRDDGAALLAVLTSPLFALSDDLLLHLCTRFEEDGSLAYGDLSRGWAREAAQEQHEGLSENDGRAFDLAASTLDRFVRQASTGGSGQASAVLRALFVESGLLDRLAAQGTEGAAEAGNLQKACAIVEKLEERTCGIASLSFAYGEHLRTAKEAPGLLSSSGSSPLRIMTIHSSKGLQFGHVAVAEAGDGREASSSLIVENVGANTYLSSASPLSTPAAHSTVRGKLHRAVVEADERWTDSEAIATALAGRDRASLSPGEVRCALAAWAKEQARSEARRLLYVALTRAVRSIFLAVRTDAKPDEDYVAAGIYHEVFTAFPWDAEARRSCSLIDFGGSAPAEVRYEKLVGPLEAEAEEGEDGQGPAVLQEEAAEPFKVAVRERPILPHLRPHGFGRENVRSYSSLDHEGFAIERDEAASAVELPDVPMEDAEEQALLSYGRDEDATALGTAFHRLAQRAIVLARAQRQAPFILALPDEEAIAAQIRAQGLSVNQSERLRQALDRWFGSDLAQRFGAHGTIAAEVPFMVRIEREGSAPLYLEGEIDGLADDGGGRAFFIDYKTGGSPEESDATLHAKHLQQAQCYAYALMREGYDAVEARFVRVEQPDRERPEQPGVVEYSFDRADMAVLEAAIVAAAR